MNDPFHHLTNMRKELEELFSGFPNVFGLQQAGWVRVDLHEADNEIIAICDLPGLEKRQDIQIDVEHNILHISGSLNKTSELKGDHIYRQERYMGKFQRSISLPSTVDREGISATYKNGILEIRMPKSVTDNRQEIDIEFN